MTRCIDCADESPTPRCARCATDALERARRKRIGEGARVMALVGVPENLLEARGEAGLLQGVGSGDRPGVVMYGPPGVGKTYNAAALVRRHLWKLAQEAPDVMTDWWCADGGVRFTRVDALMQDVRRSFDGEGDEASAVESWGRAGFLVLDDLGAEKRSEWSAQTLHSLLSQREAGKLTTVVTTNYDREDLRDMYAGWGPPIVSRLDALCAWVPVTGDDRRRA